MASKKVIWYGKSYPDEFTPADKQVLNLHMVELAELKGKDAANDYMLYLTNFTKWKNRNRKLNQRIK